jgi:two-component system, chemotaxis family, protein-glutamate methylesterase/glutaminase
MPTPAAPAARPDAIRAVVCDDSPFMRRLLSDALRACGVRIVGEAGDGQAALDLCDRLHPDVMTLDVQMPGMSGMDVLRRMPHGGPGVIVVSAYTQEGSGLAVEALSIGAAEVIRKPGSDTPLARFAAELAAAVQAAAAARRGGRVTPPRSAPQPVQRRDEPPRTAPAPRAATPPPRSPSATTTTRRVTSPIIVIASSTGGPKALSTLVPNLPNPCGAGVVIVQHMPAGFTASLAQRLNATSRLDVREARSGDRVEPGVALLAPGGHHLRLRHGTVSLTDDAPIGGLRPRADLTIEDAARDWPGRCLLVVLTGMGNDGTRGAHALHAAGGIVLSEAEETCVVYGMPRAVRDAGLVDIVQPLDQLAGAITGALRA